jgi:RimJ/RimL family protein N-acetyltransferase
MLKGERVLLRGIEKEDLRRLHELYQGDLELAQLAFSNPTPEPLASMERWFDHRYVDAEDQASFVIMVDDTIIGSCSLHHQNRRDSVTSCGIGIYDRAYLSKGYGREALNLLVDYAFRVQAYRRMWLETLALNERAIRSYRACGFVEEGRLREHAFYNGEYVDAIIMGLLCSDWKARRAK